jgi:hypothetical protein
MKTQNSMDKLLATLDVLERELLAAGDEEVLAAAAELGLAPDMKGSIALVGVTQLVRRPPATREDGNASGKAARGRKTRTERSKD